MKLTCTLLQQNVGRMFRDHWKIQGKKVIYDNGSLKAVKEKGLEFEDAADFINKIRPAAPITCEESLSLRELIGPPIIKYDTSHPDYKDVKCLTYSDHNVLIEGIKQAQVLTNSIVLEPSTLPVWNEISDEESLLQDKLVRRCIRSSLLYDAYQEKLPKRKDPQREAWNFPRDYGITDRRRNYLLTQRLLQLCSSFNPHLLGQRSTLTSGVFRLPYKMDNGEQLLFSIRGDAVVFSSNSPPVGAHKAPAESKLPDLSPLTPTVSMETTNIYKFEPFFPITKYAKNRKIHTVIIHYNETETGNKFETPVTTEQILGRTMVHSWVYAMSQALWDGIDGDIKEPVKIQAVQTDGKFFHFGVMKLSSTRLDTEAPPNLFWSFPIMNLFEVCSYVDGLPVLQGYNPKVFQTLFAFYNNS